MDLGEKTYENGVRDKTLEYLEGQFKNLADKIDFIETKVDKIDGQTKGMKTLWSFIVGGVAVIASIVAVLKAFGVF